MTTHNMRALRLQLVDCERSLRQIKDQYEAAKADLSKRAFDTATVTGKNAEERDRNLIVHLASKTDHEAALALLRDAEWQRDRCAALLEAAKDDRRAAEWQIRAKLADGLFRQQVQSDADDPAGDTAFDDMEDDLPF